MDCLVSYLHSPMVNSVVRSGGGSARCGGACGAAAAADVGWQRGSGTSAGAARTHRPAPRILLHA